MQLATTTYLRVLDGLPGRQNLTGTDVQVLSQATSKRSRDSLIISVASGAMLAMALGLIFGSLVGLRRERVSGDTRRTTAGGLPVLARIPPPGGGPSPGDPDLAGARLALAHRSVAHVVAVPTSAGARSAAALLEDTPTMPTGSGSRTAIVASTRSRLDDLTRLHQELDRAGQEVAGVVIVEDRR